MESIDVRDLPEDLAQMVAAFVEFLRQRTPPHVQSEGRPASVPTENPFAVWPLGAKGTLSREEIYDYL